ncbi:MAG: Txe/YoeB family addiction module toxin [Alphaproteobacteria bacterium]|nr:MAG: Txe/YoeB family addiction module toxin [Alphaproteobacteria bacterium]
MKVTFDPEGWSEYLGWQQADVKVLQRINVLIEECRRHSFTGTGGPEPLRQNLTGWWSRRITGEHRLVYRVRGSGDAQALEILSCRYHY